MVAQGDDVGPGVQNELGLLGGDAHPGGVLPVHHGEVHVFELLEGAQVVAEVVEAPLAHNIAHG